MAEYHRQKRREEEFKKQQREDWAQHKKESINMTKDRLHQELSDAELEAHVQKLLDSPEDAAEVKSIHFNEHKLTRIPPNLAAFPRLITIDLWESQLTTLSTSPTLFAMTWLRELCLVRAFSLCVCVHLFR